MNIPFSAAAFTNTIVIFVLIALIIVGVALVTFHRWWVVQATGFGLSILALAACVAVIAGIIGQ